MRASLIEKVVGNKVAIAILLGLVGAILTGVVVVNTFSSTNLGNANVKLVNETFSNDPDVTVVQKAIKKASGNAAAQGDSPPGIEAAAAAALLRNPTWRRNYIYSFELRETAVDSWQSGEDFKVDVYMDDGSTTTLLATLYFKQDVVDDANVEAVELEVDTGSPIAWGNTFSAIVTRQ